MAGLTEGDHAFDMGAEPPELTARLNETQPPDYLTLSGSGEPTLNRDLGSLIERIKRHVLNSNKNLTIQDVTHCFNN